MFVCGSVAFCTQIHHTRLKRYARCLDRAQRVGVTWAQTWHIAKFFRVKLRLHCRFTDLQPIVAAFQCPQVYWSSEVSWCLHLWHHLQKRCTISWQASRSSSENESHVFTLIQSWITRLLSSWQYLMYRFCADLSARTRDRSLGFGSGFETQFSWLAWACRFLLRIQHEIPPKRSLPLWGDV